MKIDSAVIQPLISAFEKYGFWGLFALVFIIFGMKHVAPIIAAIGTIYNDKNKTTLSHKRSMKKIDNKKLSDVTGKEKGTD